MGRSGPAGLFGLLHQLFGHRQQVEHVGGRIHALSFGQRARQPVGARLALVQFNLHVLRHQRRKTAGERPTGKGRQDLGVDHRRRQRFKGVEKHFKIFTAGMQELHHGGVGQQVDKRLPLLDRQRIDEGELFTVVELDQAQLRIVGARSDKLGVQRNLGMLSRLLADLLQSGIGSDQLIIQNIILL